MTHKCHSKRGSDQPDIYQIVLKGHLSCQWSDWFDGFTVKLDEHGQTILTGPVIDMDSPPTTTPNTSFGCFHSPGSLIHCH